MSRFQRVSDHQNIPVKHLQRLNFPGDHETAEVCPQRHLAGKGRCCSVTHYSGTRSQHRKKRNIEERDLCHVHTHTHTVYKVRPL